MTNSSKKLRYAICRIRSINRTKNLTQHQPHRLNTAFRIRNCFRLLLCSRMHPRRHSHELISSQPMWTYPLFYHHKNSQDGTLCKRLYVERSNHHPYAVRSSRLPPTAPVAALAPRLLCLLHLPFLRLRRTRRLCCLRYLRCGSSSRLCISTRLVALRISLCVFER